MSFKRVTGQRDVRTLLVDSTTVIARGDIVRTDEAAGDLLAGATNNPVKAIALEASASGSTDEIKVDILRDGDVVRADVASGETSVATDKGKFVDINSKSDITRTPTNNDGRVVDWDGSGNSLDLQLLNLVTTEA